MVSNILAFIDILKVSSELASMYKLDAFEANLTVNWTSFESDFLEKDLNFTIDPELFEENVKQISDPYFSIIITCYIVVISISGNSQDFHIYLNVP